MLAPALPLAAQDAPPAGAPIMAGGQVVRITASDTIPAAGADVVLHRIGRDRQGPLDSLRTDRLGRFRFTFPADTTALYLLTSRHHGVQYFSDPVHTNPERPDTGIVLAVHDTSSTAPLTLEARHIVVSAPEADGSRNVVELLSLVNDGPMARIPADSASAAWSWRIPAGAIRFAVSEGELAAGAVSRSGDSVLVHAPIPPGARQLTVEYLLEPGMDEAAFPFDAAAGSVNLLLEESDATVTADGLVAADSTTVIQGRSFRRWSGSIAQGDAIVIGLPSPGRGSRLAMGALVALVGIALLWAGGRAFGRRPAGVAAPSTGQPEDPDALIDALARLDAEHAAREAREERTPDSDAAYAAARAQLKARLERALLDPAPSDAALAPGARET